MSAAIINKFMNLIGVGGQEAEEYDENEEYINDENEGFEDENVQDIYEKPPVKQRRSFSDIERESQYSPRNMQTKVIPMNTGVSSSKMVITQPTSFDQSEEICNYLKERKSIIINLEYVNKDVARRIIDFLSGASHALNGHIQKVSNSIFLLAPVNYDIESDLAREELKNKLSVSWLK